MNPETTRTKSSASRACPCCCSRFFLGGFCFLWVFREFPQSAEERSFLKELFLLLFKIFLIGLVGFALVWVVYLWHVWNYPPERQYRDTELLLSSFGFRPAVDLNLWLIKNEILRPLGQYLLGLLMVIQRSAGGNTT